MSRSVSCRRKRALIGVNLRRMNLVEKAEKSAKFIEEFGINLQGGGQSAITCGDLQSLLSAFSRTLCCCHCIAQDLFALDALRCVAVTCGFPQNVAVSRIMPQTLAYLYRTRQLARHSEHRNSCSAQQRNRYESTFSLLRIFFLQATASVCST